MSRVGLDWYKREPVAYLGDTQGLSAREHAVYAVVIDLLYQHGGSIRNDPSWIAGWISDMGTAAVRNTLISLDAKPRITIVITDEEIFQKRAKNEAKTKRKQRENAAENGRIGGEKSGKIRSASKENNNLDEASASPDTQAEKRREEIDKEEPNGSSKVPDQPGHLINGNPSPATKTRDQIRLILCKVPELDPAAADSFIAYRKGHKSRGLTETAARRLANTLQEIQSNGGDPSDALGLAEERGWATIKQDWYFNERARNNGNGNQHTSGRPQRSGPHEDMLFAFTDGEHSEQ